MRLRQISIEIDEKIHGVMFELVISQPYREPTFVWEASINKNLIRGKRPFSTFAEAFNDVRSTIFEE